MVRNDDVVVLAVHLLAAGAAEQASLWIGIVVGLITIAGAVAAIFGARRRAADRAQAELDAAFTKGAASRDDEVALITSQRDDARSDRARSDRQLEVLQARVLDYGRSLLPPIAPAEQGPDRPRRPSPGDQ